MKRILLTILAFSLGFSLSVQAYAEDGNDDKNKVKNTSCKQVKRQKISHIPTHGGRLNMAQGIEGSKINFGFSLGGSLALIDALNREKSVLGGRGTIFVHAIIPNTKTFAIGFEGGVTYLLANEQKYKETFEGTFIADKEAKVTVGNWMLPTAQLSFMGNFHPVQRFNIQIKGNIGAVLAMVPKYEAKYYTQELQSDGVWLEVEQNFGYNNDIAIGAAVTIGTKLLYAISAHTEFGVGLDWTYMQFSYEKAFASPTVTVKKELTRFGIFDLHIGFAFNF